MLQALDLLVALHAPKVQSHHLQVTHASQAHVERQQSQQKQKEA